MTSALQSNDHTANSSTATTNYDNINNMNLSTMVSPGLETTTLLQSIYALTSPTQVGTSKFMTSYCINLEKLSIQAHLSARFIGSLQSSTVNINGSNSGVGGVVATPGLGDILSTLSNSNNNYSALNGVEEEEYIVQAFLDDTTKIECLVSTLLSIELWREHVLFGSSNKKGRSQNCNTISEEEVEFEIEGGQRDELNDCYNELNDVDGGNDDISPSPLAESTNPTTSSKEEIGLANRLASNNNALRTAFILHAETTIVSLLSLIFYKGIPPELLDGSSGDDVLLSLIDYCARQLVSRLFVVWVVWIDFLVRCLSPISYPPPTYS